MKPLLFTLTLIAFAFILFTEQAKGSSWEALTLEDLRFIQQTLKENTPNAVDENNSWFNVWLDEGFEKSSEMAHRADSLTGLLATLRFYLSGFKDPHIDLRPAKPEFDEMQNMNMPDPARKWEIVAFANGEGAWVSLPFFSVKNQTHVESFQAIINQLPTLRTKKYVVLDVRGNGGGQSYWGTQVLKGLFGKSYIEEIFNSVGYAYDEWRVSKENLAVLKTKYLPFVREKMGEHSPEFQYIEETISAMKHELEKGRNGLVKSMYKPVVPEKAITPPQPSLYNGKVILLTDGWCGSSCLTFVGEVLHLPNVLHVGQETSEYSPYVEARQVELPSKNGTFAFPMKVLRNSTQKPNQPYVPTLIYPGDINATPQLKEWLESYLKSNCAS